MENKRITLKSRAELEKMRTAGRVVYQVLQHCREMCKPGITTREIDEEACRFYEAQGARGLFKNYPTYKPGEGFPANLCISVNETVVHGIASDRVIKEGDIVGIDCGVELTFLAGTAEVVTPEMKIGPGDAVEHWCGDSATTVMVGQVRPEVRRLCEVTQHVLDLAIQNVRPGRRWSQVARLMQSYAESNGMSVVRDYVGHGIGRTMHEGPTVPNFVSHDLLRHDIELRAGLVLAIEPMCNLGGADVTTLADGWTVLTVDRQPSAHYEHTVAVTATGAEVLTDGR